MALLGDLKEQERELDELEINIKRLRIEYEQFFRGAMKREPSGLKNKVQKIITKYSSESPRNTTLKFRFNSLNSRFQSFRQLWGRTLREMEAGTYAPHRFKLKQQTAQEAEQLQAGNKELASLERQADEVEQRREEAQPTGSPLERLHGALLAARQKTGERTDDFTRERLAALVKKQTEAIRAQRGADAKIKFKVVIEDNRAKLKATIA